VRLVGSLAGRIFFRPCGAWGRFAWIRRFGRTPERLTWRACSTASFSVAYWNSSAQTRQPYASPLSWPWFLTPV
jgi:hypothetical protein